MCLGSSLLLIALLLKGRKPVPPPLGSTSRGLNHRSSSSASAVRRCRYRTSPVRRRYRDDGSNTFFSDGEWLLIGGGAMIVGNVAGYISYRRTHTRIERMRAQRKIESEEAQKKLQKFKREMAAKWN